MVSVICQVVGKGKLYRADCKLEHRGTVMLTWEGRQAVAQALLTSENQCEPGHY